MRTWFKILFWIVGVLGAIAGVLRLFFVDVWTVPIDDPTLAASIEPTLSAGDVVVLTRRTDVTRGNLLRCADPQAPGRFVVARAIASQGERVEIVGEVVSIDSHRNPSPRACDTPVMTIHDPQADEDQDLACSVEDFGEVVYDALRSTRPTELPVKATVDPGNWYLVSDDRHVHLDSRDYGQVDPRTCQHIILRLMSAAGPSDAKKRLTVIW